VVGWSEEQRRNAPEDVRFAHGLMWAISVLLLLLGTIALLIWLVFR
jgi:hypothetical protein